MFEREEQRDYEIGFGKSPKDHQFKPGRSGNPKGRPKGSRNIGSVIRDICDQEVQVKENGVVKYRRKLDAILIQMANKAMSGDHKAAKEFVRLAQAHEVEQESLGTPILNILFRDAKDGRPYPPEDNNDPGSEQT